MGHPRRHARLRDAGPGRRRHPLPAGREADWAEGNLFTVHNWWHLALYLLEAGRSDESLAIYDRHIHNEDSAGVPLEMLDASALLWRLHLDGIDTGGRFAPLADAWATRTSDEPWYVFNDLHAVMALVGAGRLADARAVIDRLDAYVATAAPSSNVRMTAEVGLPASRCGAGATPRVATPTSSPSCCRSGRSSPASAARTPSATRSSARSSSPPSASGQLDLARALLDERLGVRETSVWSWRRRGQVLAADRRRRRGRTRRTASRGSMSPGSPPPLAEPADLTP